MRTASVEAIILAALLRASCWGCGARRERDAARPHPGQGEGHLQGQARDQGLDQVRARWLRPEARGEIQSDGTFVLTTYKEGDGVVAGQHRVSISETGSRAGQGRPAREIREPEQPRSLTADVDAEHTEFTFDLQ